MKTIGALILTGVIVVGGVVGIGAISTLAVPAGDTSVSETAVPDTSKQPPAPVLIPDIGEIVDPIKDAPKQVLPDIPGN